MTSPTNLRQVVLPMGVDARGFTTGLTKAQRSLQQFAASMNVLGFRMSAIFAATFGAVGGFSLKVGKDFEAAFAGVKKTVDPLTTDFAKLEKQIIAQSKATGFAAAELADLTRIGGQLGVTGTANLEKFTDTIAKLSIAAAELTPEQAARGLARLMALAGEDPQGIDKVASTLAFLGDKLPTTEERILNFAVILGGMAKTANLSSEQLLGIAGGFSSVVEGTERASTAVQRVIQQMIESIAEGGTKLDEFGRIAGMTGEEFKVLFERDAGEGIAKFIEGLQRLKDEGADKVFKSLKALDLQNLRTVQSLLAASGAADLFRKATNAATTDVDRHLKLEREFAIQLATVARQWDRVKAAFVAVGIKVFQAFREQIMKVIEILISLATKIEAFADEILDMSDFTKFAIVALGGFLAALSGLLIVFGTLGGAIVAAMSLWNALSGVLVVATAAVGKFAAANGLLLIGLTSFAGLAIVVGGAAKFMSDALFPASLAMEDLPRSTREAAAELGFFGRIVEFVKILFENFIAPLGETISSFAELVGITNSAADASDRLGDSIEMLKPRTKTLVQHFLELVSGTKLMVATMEKLWELNRLIGAEEEARERKIRDLYVASRIAGEAITDWTEAQRILREEREKFAVVNEKNRVVEESEAAATQRKKVAIQDLIATLRAAGAENKELADISKFLNIPLKELESIIEDIGPEFKDAALGAAALAKSQEEAAKEAERLGKAFQDMSVDEAKKDFAAYKDALRDAIDSGVEFTKEGAKKITGELMAFSAAAGEPIGTEFAHIITQAVERGLDADMVKIFDDTLDKVSNALRSKGEKLKGLEMIGVGKKGKADKDLLFGGLNLSEEMMDIATGAKAAREKAAEEAFKAADSVRKATEAMFNNMADTVRGLESVFNNVGLSAENFFRRITIGGLSAVSSIGALVTGIGGFKDVGDKLFASGDAAKGGFLTGLTGGKGGFAGLLTGISNVSSLIGPIASIASTVGSLIGSLFKKEFQKVGEEVGRDFGVSISEELAKTIEKEAASLGIGRFEAILLSLGDIIEEAGGIGADNFNKFNKGFNDLMNAVAMGSVPMREGMEEVDKVFVQMVDHLQTLGVTGDVEIAKMIARMKELGLVSAETAEFIKQTATDAVSNLAKFFDILSEKTNLTKEEAASALPVLAGAFNAALQAAGSLVGAIQMLPESFGDLLSKFRELLGEENAVLNTLTQYYNFVKENETQLAAIDALSQAFSQLVQLGIVNKDTINDFANSFKQQFDQLLAATNDETTALITMGPQIAQLMEAFQAMGVQVPEWLSNLAEKAKEAGASLEPPEGLPDILKDIRDILFEIATAFGVAAGEARNFGNAAAGAGNSRPNPPGGGRGIPPERRGASGMDTVVNSPSRFLAGEGGGPERVQITPLTSSGDPKEGVVGGGGASINVTVDARGAVGLNGQQLGTVVAEELAKVIQFNPGGIKTTIKEAAAE